MQMGRNFKVFLKKRSKDSLTKLTSCLLQNISVVVVKISVLAWFNSLLKRGQKITHSGIVSEHVNDVL